MGQHLVMARADLGELVGGQALAGELAGQRLERADDFQGLGDVVGR